MRDHYEAVFTLKISGFVHPPVCLSQIQIGCPPNTLTKRRPGPKTANKRLRPSLSPLSRSIPALTAAGDAVADHATSFRKVEDFWRLHSVAKSAAHVAVVGGGFLGSELACALGNFSKKRDGQLKVTQLFPGGLDFVSVQSATTSATTTTTTTTSTTTFKSSKTNKNNNQI